MQRREWLVDDLVGDRRQRVTAERLAPGQAFIETDAEGEDVGAAVDGGAFDLLWRHVVRSA